MFQDDLNSGNMAGTGKGAFPAETPIGMAYVPVQTLGAVYDLAEAYDKGTVFPDLDLPWHPSRGGYIPKGPNTMVSPEVKPANLDRANAQETKPLHGWGHSHSSNIANENMGPMANANYGTNPMNRGMANENMGPMANANYGANPMNRGMANENTAPTENRRWGNPMNRGTANENTAPTENRRWGNPMNRGTANENTAPQANRQAWGNPMNERSYGR